MQHVLRCWWLAFLVLTACFDPQFDERHIMCGPNESCPPGLMCVGGYCSTQPQMDSTSNANLTVVLGGNAMGTVTSVPIGIDCGSTCTAAFTKGTSVTLTAAPSAGNIFVGWSGACSGTGPCTVQLDTSITVTANFATDNSLVVVRAGNGSGVVSSNPAGINCGGDCSEQFAAGTTVVLTASPATGSQFDGWSGGGCSGIGTCTVTTDTATMVTATFSLTQHTLSVTLAGNGSGTVTSPPPSSLSCGPTCTATVNYNSMVTLTATPNTGSTFTRWSGGGCSGTGPCTVTVTQATSVTATFTLTQHDIMVTKAGNGSGTVKSGEATPLINCGTACMQAYDYGTTVTLSATPAGGSTFAGWSPSSICTGTGSCVIDVTMAASVTATFTLNSYTLTAGKSGNGFGTVVSDVAGINCGTDCSGSYLFNTVVTLTPMAATGSTFNGWSGVTGCPGTGTCTVTVTTAATATANFTLDSEDLTVSKSGTGSGTITGVGIGCPGDCTETYDYGTNVTLSASASPGSTFIGWTGGGCGSAGTGSCVVPMTTAQNVSAQFTLQTYQLTVQKSGTGAGTVTSQETPTALINCGTDCNEVYGYGSNITLTATPTAGTDFAGWTGAPGCSSALTCLVNVTATTNVTATFNIQTKTLSVGTSGNGGCTITSNVGGINCGSTCGATYNYGTVVQLSASPASGSTFVGWTAPAGCSGNGTCDVTMNATTTATANCVLGTNSMQVVKVGSGTVTSDVGHPGINCGSDCSENYTNGQTVTLTAAAATGSTFSGWSGVACPGTGTCTVTISTAVTITATFTLDTHSLMVSKTGTGGGTVTSSPGTINCGSTCTNNFNYGTSVTLTATPDGSSAFNGWSGSGCTGTGTCVITTNADSMVMANFIPLTYLLTIQKIGNGANNGTVSASGITCGADCTETYNAGTIVHLTASVPTGTVFNGWQNAPGCTTAATCDVTMSAATTVKADFSQTTHQLSVSKSGSGTVTSSETPAGINCGGDCNETYNYGTSVTLTASAATGYTFAGWSGVGGCPGTGACTLTITAATNVTATFSLNIYTMTVNVAGNGSGSVSSSPTGITCGAAYATQDCTQDYNHGTSVTLTEVPMTGTNFTGWAGGGCTGSATTCVVPMTQAASVTATFTLQQYQLTVNLGGTGSGGVLSVPSGINCGAICSKFYDYGTVVQLTATAASGSTFNTWSGITGCGTASACSVTIGTAAITAIARFDAIPPNKVFISQSYGITTIGSPQNGDSLCQQEANQNGLGGANGGVFHAWLSSPTSNATDRLGTTASGWVRVDGKPFANTKADFMSGKLFSPPRLMANGNDVGSLIILTGTTTSGVYSGAGDCNNFSMSGNMTSGRTDSGSSMFVNYGTVGCSSGTFRLLCVANNNAAVVTVPQPTGSIRRAFMYVGWKPSTNGITDADTACRTEATAKGLNNPTAYKALLPTTAASALSRFDTSASAGNWYRTDDMPILPSANAWNTATSFDSGPNVSADGQTYFPNYGVWVGANSFTTPATSSADICGDWKATAGNGRVGTAGYTVVSLFLATNTYGSCNNNSVTLVCLEQ